MTTEIKTDGINPREPSQSSFSPVHRKVSPRKVDAVQLVFYPDVVDDELLIYDLVSNPLIRDLKVFALIAVAALPR